MAADGHFRAFSFVDRISSHETGRHIRGSYAIPAGTNFPPALIAEAVGQLAAWAAMSALEFKSRPVAGLAAGIDFLGEVGSAQVLDLAVQLESLDAEAIAYHGTAHAHGVPLIQLQDCVGPMVSVEEFDDPQALRDRFVLLCGAGASPGAFGGVGTLALELDGGEPGQSLRAVLHVPDHAPFFADHFPRRPVLPGTLLMHSNLELVAKLAATFPLPATGGRWVLRGISDMKLSAFTPPGERLEIEACVGELSTDAAIVNVQNRNSKRVIGKSRVRLALEGCS